MNEAGLDRFLFVGGTRCGKSALALSWGEQVSPRRLFVATARIADQEMAERISRHQQARGKGWEVLEDPLLTRLWPQLEGEGSCGLVLIDCLSSWVANLFEDGAGAEEIVTKVRHLCRKIEQARVPLGLVSLETGLGIVPVTALGRSYRDVLGICNQLVARVCTGVFFIACGLPLVLKGVLPNALAFAGGVGEGHDSFS